MSSASDLTRNRSVRDRSFLHRVRAEQLPTRLQWHGRDWVAVLAVPAIFVASHLVTQATDDLATRAVADTSVRIVLFVLLVIANRELLIRHWHAFWAARWRSIGLVLIGLVVVQAVISILGALLRPLAQAGEGTGDAGSAASLAFGIMLFASINPVVTALIEDFTFRHTLLLKFPVWNRIGLATALTVVNALAFGAIHVGNFDGVWLLTLSYAGAGLVMNLAYLWTRNIWHVLLMHGLNNFILGGPITVLLVHLLTAVSG